MKFLILGEKFYGHRTKRNAGSIFQLFETAKNEAKLMYLFEYPFHGEMNLDELPGLKKKS